MITYILFFLGFLLLIKGADFLVEGAATIARKLKVSNIVIGLTIVSFGTSAPELVVNVFASTHGNTELAIGNILGSNISNILLILGVSAMIFPLRTQMNTTWKEIPFSLLAVLVMAIMANDIRLDHSEASVLSRSDGMILLAFFIIFLYYSFGISKVSGEAEDIPVLKNDKPWVAVVSIIGGLIGLTLGGKWIVDGAVKIALSLGMSEATIGLTIVAIGTSLPELATSAVAAWKKQSDIAIGNVVGSNIFNVFWILGFSAIISPIPFHHSSDIDILVVIAASMILFSLLFIGKRHVIERWQGGLMTLMYIVYLIWVIRFHA
jgi:cation:H+ antiporter